MNISSVIKRRIQHELAQLEQDESIKILFAVESGSRAWGFPSKDSDYDVRFVYVRKPWDYIAVYPLRDVIERPITDELDISGWDLKKAFGLLRKSNPALMEWLHSPLVYQDYQPHVETFRQFATQAFLPLASCHHYRSMARKHQMRSAKKNQVRLKHYLYTLRPCLSALWVIEKGTQPPMRFADLVETFLPSGEVRTVVDRLVRMKSDSTETGSVERLPVLDAFIHQTLEHMVQNLPEAIPAMSQADCNEQFRQMLSACWTVNAWV